jgi:acetyl-CoA carboxylase biotin carboxyl carrier protein
MPDTPAESRPIDASLVRELADILSDTGLTEIEVERGDLRIRVAREVTVAAAPMVQHVAAPMPPAAAPTQPAAPGPAAAPQGDTVNSPMVGTAYLQAKPGDPPFVREGDTVSEGQTLLIIEAMKTMNPVPAPRAGRIVQVLVSDSQPVEYGEPLFVIA